MKMKAIGIREFKARLSQYLRLVQEGETLNLTSHGEVIAEVRKPQRASTPTSKWRHYVQQAALRGEARPASTADIQAVADRNTESVPWWTTYDDTRGDRE